MVSGAFSGSSSRTIVPDEVSRTTSGLAGFSGLAGVSLLGVVVSGLAGFPGLAEVSLLGVVASGSA